MVTSMSGTDAEDEDPAKTQADVTAVALALDAEGKIVAISIDVVQLSPLPRALRPSASWAMTTT